MHVKSLSQGLNFDLAQPGLEPGISWLEAKCLPLDHNATNVCNCPQSLCAPEPDPQLEVTHYERTWETNEELGLNDMNTENYEQT